MSSATPARSALAVVEPKALAVVSLEDRAKRIIDAHSALGGCMEQAGNWAVILGLELQAASAALGERRGGDKSKTAKIAVLLPGQEPAPKKQTFPEWLNANCPAVKLRSAELYMQLAKAAKNHLIKNGEEAIRALLTKPAGDLSETDRKTLLGNIRKITDGKTYEQLALEFGIKGGKGRKQKKGTGNNGQDAKNENSGPPIGWTPEEWDARNAADPQEQNAIDLFRPIELSILAELETDTLAHLPAHFRDTLAAAVEQLSAKLAEISAAKPKKGAKAK